MFAIPKTHIRHFGCIFVIKYIHSFYSKIDACSLRMKHKSCWTNSTTRNKEMGNNEDDDNDGGGGGGDNVDEQNRSRTKITA